MFLNGCVKPDSVNSPKVRIHNGTTKVAPPPGLVKLFCARACQSGLREFTKNVNSQWHHKSAPPPPGPVKLFCARACHSGLCEFTENANSTHNWCGYYGSVPEAWGGRDRVFWGRVVVMTVGPGPCIMGDSFGPSWAYLFGGPGWAHSEGLIACFWCCWLRFPVYL